MNRLADLDHKHSATTWIPAETKYRASLTSPLPSPNPWELGAGSLSLSVSRLYFPISWQFLSFHFNLIMGVAHCGECVEVRGQLVGASSLLQPRGYPGSNLSCQAW